MNLFPLRRWCNPVVTLRDYQGGSRDTPELRANIIVWDHLVEHIARNLRVTDCTTEHSRSDNGVVAIEVEREHDIPPLMVLCVRAHFALEEAWHHSFLLVRGPLFSDRGRFSEEIVAGRG